MFTISTFKIAILYKRISILSVIFVSYGFTFFSAQAATIPDSATPGRVLPREAPQFPPIPVDDGTLEIPRVIDRPLSVDEGDRVMVSEFILQGVQSHDEYGIRVEDVAFMAEANRVRRQRLGDEESGGFTDEDLDGITEFIRRLVEEPNQRPTSSELWKLVFQLRNSKWNRGLTIGQIQEVADEITRYYRQRGLILATAFIPAQEVKEGKVIIQVLEGNLGDVQTESNDMYSSRTILKSFDPLKNQVVHKDTVESQLLYLSDYPGLNVSGVFQPGKVLGESDLIIKVLDEQRIDGWLKMDNNGSVHTGEIRAKANVSVNNPLGFADKLSMNVIKSLSEGDARGADGNYGSLAYITPFFRNDWHIGASVTYNEFSIREEPGIEDISGDSTIVSGYLKKQFQRHRAYNIYGLGEMSRKNSSIQLQKGADPNKNEYDVAKLELGFDNIDTRFAGINVGVLQLFHGAGTRLGADGFHDTNLEGGFRKVNLSFSRLQTLFKNSSLLFTTQYQLAEHRLNSLEQFSLGGADNVRAYPVSEYLRDNAYFASLEWIINAPGFADNLAFMGRSWGELFSVSLFYDIASGWQVESNDGIMLQGAGVAVKFNLPNEFMIKLQAATIVGDKEPDASEGSEQYYFDLVYYF